MPNYAAEVKQKLDAARKSVDEALKIANSLQANVDLMVSTIDDQIEIHKLLVEFKSEMTEL
jgi:hypothetical protein